MKVVLESRLLPPLILVDGKEKQVVDTRPGFNWRMVIAPYITVTSDDGINMFTWGIKRRNIFKELMLLTAVIIIAIIASILMRKK